MDSDEVSFATIFTPVVRESQAPRYAQVMSQIESAIRRGLLPQGTYLPKENELCDLFTVARSTLRRAMGLLEAKGTISRTRKRGTRVEQRVLTSYRPETSRTIFELISANRQVPRSIVRRFEEVVCTPELSLLTGFPVGVQLVSVVRERFTNETPLALIDTFTLAECIDFGEDVLVDGSLNAALEAAGWTTDHIDYEISAAPLDAAWSEFMGVPAGSPVLLEKRSSYSGAQLFSFSLNYYHPNNFQIRGRVDRDSG